MTPKEVGDRRRLNKKWACGTATRKEITRCMELDRTFAFERKVKKEGNH